MLLYTVEMFRGLQLGGGKGKETDRKKKLL